MAHPKKKRPRKKGLSYVTFDSHKANASESRAGIISVNAELDLSNLLLMQGGSITASTDLLQYSRQTKEGKGVTVLLTCFYNPEKGTAHFALNKRM